MNRKKSGSILIMIALLSFIAGVCTIGYPHMSQWQYQRETNTLIGEFDRRMTEAENGHDWYWLYQLMIAYNQKLFTEKQKNLVDPFAYSQPDFSLKEFGFDEEMIGHLSIPKMGITLPIYLGANKGNMKKGAAHLTQTSLPVGGINTNAVIAAHRGMSTATMFRNIEKLTLGDKVTITNFCDTLYYQVAEIKIIDPTDIDEILIQPGRDLVTLITCHPYRRNNQRYVVYCQRVTAF